MQQVAICAVGVSRQSSASAQIASKLLALYGPQVRRARFILSRPQPYAALQTAFIPPPSALSSARPQPAMPA